MFNDINRSIAIVKTANCYTFLTNLPNISLQQYSVIIYFIKYYCYFIMYNVHVLLLLLILLGILFYYVVITIIIIIIYIYLFPLGVSLVLISYVLNLK